MRNSERTHGHAVLLARQLAVTAGLWCSVSPAADPGKPTDVKDGATATVGGILTTDGNVNSLMALTDGEETPVKYVFGEKFDKEALKGIFSVNRVQLTYVPSGDTRKLLRIKKERPRIRGAVTGVVVLRTDFWVAVKPPNGPPDGYALNWPPGRNSAKLKGLRKGDRVRIRFHTNFERHRVEALDVVGRKAGAEDNGVVVQKDIEYGKAGGISLRLDVYRPKGPAAKTLPAVIWIHGGGWGMGDKATADVVPGMKVCPAIARRGYFVASINYRLAGVAKFPAAIQDCKCAVR